MSLFLTLTTLTAKKSKIPFQTDNPFFLQNPVSILLYSYFIVMNKKVQLLLTVERT